MPVPVLRPAALAVLLALWAGTAAANGDDDSCNAAALADLVGRPVAEVQDRLPEGARVIPADSAVTQDYRTGRVNVDLDDDRVITRIWCG